MSPTALARQARRLNRELARLYPDARIELNFTSPLELLAAAVLTTNTTDRRVNKLNRELFAGTAPPPTTPVRTGPNSRR